MDFVDGLKDGLKHRAADLIDSSEALVGVVTNNPERMRALLNLMLTPQFKPTFIDKKPSEEASFQAFAPASEQTPSIPSRMFDIDTGNMVERLEPDDVGQYCMLSHSWKDTEVDLAYVEKAKERNREKIKAKEPAAKNDVDMIKNLCREEIKEKEDTIKELLQSVEGERSKFDIGQILEERIKVKSAKRQLKWANKAFTKAQADFDHAENEADAFKNLAKEMVKKVSPDECHQSRSSKMLSEAGEGEKNPGGEEVEKAKKALDAARADRDKKVEDSKKVEDATQFFEDNTLLREAVDGLNELMNRWKSAVKIDQSIERAKAIFKEGLFPLKEGGKRYLWNDTCCIKKTDFGELVDSLSLMGDWYTNADFCLVHLDTAPCDDEWNDEWKRYLESTEEKLALPDPNIEKYSEILKGKPAWSTRGWTLQELVLSKTTFYVNSAWKRLERPQEKLGPYYFFCPFIELYTGGKAPKDHEGLRSLWESIVKEHELKVTKFVTVDDDDSDEDVQDKEKKVNAINAAQHLIAILDALEFSISASINKETAVPLIGHAIYLAAGGMRKEVTKEDGNKWRLHHNLSVRLESYIYPNTEKSSRPEDDARRVITLLLQCLVAETKDWIIKDRQYIAKFGNIDTLERWKSGTARTNFSTHRVMSLACNRRTTVETDRAYSLMGLLGVRFPTFNAEGLPKALARLFDETLTLSNDVSVFNWTGRQMGSHIRGRSLYPSSLQAFDTNRVEGQSMANKRLASLLQTKRTEVMRTFRRITSMLQNTIKFLKEQDHHRHLPMKWIIGIIQLIYAADFEELDPQVHDLERILKWVENKCGKVWANKDKKPANLLGDGVLGLGDSVADLAKNPMKGLLGGLHRKRSRFGLGDLSPSSKRVKTEDGTPASPTPSSTDTIVDPFDEPSLKAAIEKLTEKVEKYLQESQNSLREIRSRNGKDDDGRPRLERVPTLPKEVLEQLTQIDQPECKQDDQQNLKQQEPGTMISPNPIIVNNSGIRGVFDIQRVVITFHEEEKLWDQVERAVSPKQRITGWCSISTGFARVMVSFSCEKHILEKQLKIAQVIQKKVVDDPLKTANGKITRGDRIMGLDEKHEEQEKHAAHHTEAERKVSRMIAFIQEESLEAIAGEWVLARFSDVKGANWFLCSLELGSTHNFHGHRISTDRIDFSDAIPEPGLINVWVAYMNRKKRKLCYILRDYLQGRAMCSARDLIFSHGDDAEGAHPAADGSLGHLVDLGMTAVQNAAQLTTLTLREKFYELRADILDKQLTAAVLKYTPKELQPAVENLNADQDFLPATFKSGREVHMF
ncbi:hypothetical protein DBV05_g12513 [Lasiodiplodia theobromae]|uniref:Heterokaryon incompatibility domain-containing protein n=1 Tax=Lasiodiplodia theobromae TaxID=45133 RepID=A0A5N5CTY0_9PEZI|nr:hypothetical protein DBV05_g12513 [Lasiodiplodia theobromae]